MKKIPTLFKRTFENHKVVGITDEVTEGMEWVKKCYQESRKDGTLVVMLIPSRTDTKYFHDYILHRAEVRFIKGRLKFGDSKNSAPFPSMIVIFRAACVN